MSAVTIGNLERVSAAALSKRLLADQAAGNPSIAVVDVRDDDYIGGHIKGAVNVPSLVFDSKLQKLVQQLADKKTVVFHCALSQQRGPSAALKYIRERERKAAQGASGLSNVDGQTDAEKQEVLVLDKGFVGWQENYGEDERLTEGYRKELWAHGY